MGTRITPINGPRLLPAEIGAKTGYLRQAMSEGIED
jgi:hypothetical protein